MSLAMREILRLTASDGCERKETRGHLPAREIPINRVLVDAEGEALNVARAIERGITSVDVVLIRSDGWVLACAKHLAEDAKALWPGEWDHVVHLNPARMLSTVSR